MTLHKNQNCNNCEYLGSDSDTIEQIWDTCDHPNFRDKYDSSYRTFKDFLYSDREKLTPKWCPLFEIRSCSICAKEVDNKKIIEHEGNNICSHCWAGNL